MKHAQRRFLITPHQYDQLVKKNGGGEDDGSVDRLGTPGDPYYIPHPSARTAREASQSVAKTLESSTASEFDKTIAHAQELQRYLQGLRDALTVPKSLAYTGLSTPASMTSTATTTDSASSTPPPHQPPSSRRPRTPPSTPIRPKRAKKASKIPVRTPTSSNLTAGPITSAQPTPPATPQTSAGTPQQYSEERIVQDLRLSASEKARAKSMFDKLKSNPNFAWNKKTGRITVNNKTRARSNLRSLLSEALADQRQFSTPSDFNAFRRLLQPKK